MSVIADKVEIDILLKMYYDKYEPENCKIKKDKNAYYVSGVNINGTRLFNFVKTGLGRKVVTNQNIFNSDEYDAIASVNLTDTEKLIVMSYLLGNTLMKDSVPSKVRNKLATGDSVVINESEEVTLQM